MINVINNNFAFFFCSCFAFVPCLRMQIAQLTKKQGTRTTLNNKVNQTFHQKQYTYNTCVKQNKNEKGNTPSTIEEEEEQGMKGIKKKNKTKE